MRTSRRIAAVGIAAFAVVGAIAFTGTAQAAAPSNAVTPAHAVTPAKAKGTDACAHVARQVHCDAIRVSGGTVSANGCFRKVSQTGTTTYPKKDGGWAEETLLLLAWRVH